MAEYVRQIPHVSGKMSILHDMTEASIAHPDVPVREAIYPAAGGEKQLRELLADLAATGQRYQMKVTTRMRSSYAHHYRRVLLRALELLALRSNNTRHRPVLDAVKHVLDHRDDRSAWFPPEAVVPTTRDIVPEAM
ncbi:MAG: Tn3 family transposase, partial [bacterium]|nr:Tn3 family transposase [bacterium]